MLRLSIRQAVAGLRDPLNFAISVWVMLGAARLWSDVRSNGPMALRDFAAVYYALFFFMAQALAFHAPSARILRRALAAACAILPVSYLIFSRYEDLALRWITFRGAPLIFYKDDLVAAYLFAGMFLLLTLDAWPQRLRYAWAAVAYGTAYTINSSRAAIVGLLVVCGWWALARRWAPWKLQAAVVPAGLMVLGLAGLLGKKPLVNTRIYSLYEHVASMVDFTGTGHYATENRQYVGDNNRFRLAWWNAVAAETFEYSPFLGLGFGADLTGRFVRTYPLDLGEDFNTRSPHSIIFTVLGRMGLVGLTAFLAIVLAMIARTVQLAKLALNDDAALVPLGWWSVAWVVFTSGCFGVVLEGPMGAVVFWTALGMANASTAKLLAQSRALEPQEASVPKMGP